MSEQRCENPAAYRYTWPGKDEAVACVMHASGIATVAKAIGLHLQLIPLGFLDEPRECTSKDGE